ncbi:MAG: phage tail assembly protein T [Nitrospiraceae bacterium]
MPAGEITEWVAYEQTYGPLLAQDRMDIGFAQLSYYLVSLLGKPQRGRSRKFADFLPVWLKPKPKPLTETQQAQILEQALRGWAAADGGGPSRP